MLKLITKVPYNVKLYLINKYNFNYLFIFGWLGFLKYRVKKNIVFSVKYLNIKLISVRNIFFTYMKLLKNFYFWTNVINKKVVTLKGVGFKYRLLKNILFIILGFSHIVKLNFCKNIRVHLVNNKVLALYSIDLFLLNRYIFVLKKFKSLDVYKGKGILVEGEKIIKKEGKKAIF